MLLRSMRSGFFSTIFLGLLVMGGVSLVFTDWNGMFKGGGNKTDVAKIDGTPIKISEFNSRVNSILRSQKIDPATAYQMGLIDNILSNEIYDILIKKNAAELGIQVEDRIIAEQIKEMIAPLKKDGADDKAALKQFLEMQGMSEKQLTTALRDELTSKILKSTISSSVYIPKALTEDVIAYKNETRNVDIAFYPNAAITIKDRPQDADLEKYYQSISSSFMLPERRDVTVAALDTSKIAKPKIADADIKAAYEDNQDSFIIPEQAEVEQTLINDEKKAKAITDAMKGGKDMKEAVKAVTGDTKAFQGKNSFSKEGLPADIATPVFAAKSGEIVGPVKSPLGFHVIKLVKLNAAHPAPFDQVKNSIRKELEDEKSGNSIFEVIGAIEDRLANGERYEDMKDEYPLTVVSLKGLTADSKPEKELEFAGKDLSVILKKAFSVTEGTASELNDITATMLFSVRLDKLSPAAAKPFSKVKETVLQSWISSNQAQENLLTTQKLVDDLNAGKSKFEGKTVQSVKALTRQGTEGVAKDVTERFMAANTGSFIMAISKEKNGVYVGRVNSATLPKASEVKDNGTNQQLQSDLSTSGYMGYLGSLQNRYPVTINEGLLKRVYATPDKDTE